MREPIASWFTIRLVTHQQRVPHRSGVDDERAYHKKVEAKEGLPYRSTSLAHHPLRLDGSCLCRLAGADLLPRALIGDAN